MAQTKTIVFIHGLFQNPASWERWIEFFSARGYTCHAPAYPYHEGVPRELRRDPNPILGHVTFGDVIHHLEKFIDGLSEKPILIGHSIGGLAVQKLLAMDQGVMAAAIDSAPPKGVFSAQWSFLRANLPTVNPLAEDSVCLPSVNWFQYAFCNTMTLAETRVEYDRYVVPESRNIPRSTTGHDGAIDLAKPHRPLLFIAGEKDHIIPASLNLKNFMAYKDQTSLREFKVWPNRTHYICSMSGWEEVADYVAGWIERTVNQPSS